MTIQVRAPNGDTVQFPDGTDDATINKVMAETYAPKPPVDTASDVAQSFGTGLRKGAVSLPGLPGTVEQLGRLGVNWAGRKMGAEGDVVSPEPFLPSAARYQELEENVTPQAQAYNAQVAASQGREPDGPQPFHRPQTRAGRYAETIGEFAPGAAMPGGIAQRIIRGVVAPAVTSEAAGQATEGTAAEPYARVAGAILGPSVPTLARRAITPLPASPERIAAANVLDDAGVELSAGQRTGSRPLQFAEDTARETPMGGGRMNDLFERQNKQFTAAALERAGMQADSAAPDVMRAASDRLGQEFDRLAASNNIVFKGHKGGPTGQALQNRTLALEADYDAAVLPSSRNPDIRDLVDDINNMAVPGGSISGQSYQAFRSRLGRMANNADADPELQRVLSGLRDALDDAMEAGMSAADKAAWQAARKQWGALMELRQAMLGGGIETAAGNITPARLAMADRNANSTRYVEGTGRYDDLARAGIHVMTPPPNSGTPGRLFADRIMTDLPMAIGAGGGLVAGGGNVPAAIAGGAIGRTVGPAMSARVLSSPITQRVLGKGVIGNQLVGKGPGSTWKQRLMSAILGGQNDASQR